LQQAGTVTVEAEIATVDHLECSRIGQSSPVAWISSSMVSTKKQEL
jgi:hypothetical protein